jgi:phage-related protein
VLWVVGGIKDIFVTVGTAIGEGLGAAVWFLTETIPDALSAAWDKITGFFSGIGSFFSEVAASIASVFRSVVDAVGGFFGKIAEFFGSIRDTVLGVIDRIRNAIAGLFDKLPSWMIPDSVIQMKQVTQMVSENRNGNTASSNALQTMPAVSDTKGRADEMARFEAGLQSIERDRTKWTAETPPFTVNVQVDGDTIARASNRASADSASRGFSPVPVY